MSCFNKFGVYYPVVFGIGAVKLDFDGEWLAIDIVTEFSIVTPHSIVLEIESLACIEEDLEPVGIDLDDIGLVFGILVQWVQDALFKVTISWSLDERANVNLQGRYVVVSIILFE